MEQAPKLPSVNKAPAFQTEQFRPSEEQVNSFRAEHARLVDIVTANPTLGEQMTVLTDRLSALGFPNDERTSSFVLHHVQNALTLATNTAEELLGFTQAGSEAFDMYLAVMERATGTQRDRLFQEAQESPRFWNPVTDDEKNIQTLTQHALQRIIPSEHGAVVDAVTYGYENGVYGRATEGKEMQILLADEMQTFNTQMQNGVSQLTDSVAANRQKLTPLVEIAVSQGYPSEVVDEVYALRRAVRRVREHSEEILEIIAETKAHRTCHTVCHELTHLLGPLDIGNTFYTPFEQLAALDLVVSYLENNPSLVSRIAAYAPETVWGKDGLDLAHTTFVDLITRVVDSPYDEMVAPIDVETEKYLNALLALFPANDQPLTVSRLQSVFADVYKEGVSLFAESLAHDPSIGYEMLVMNLDIFEEDIETFLANAQAAEGAWGKRLQQGGLGGSMIIGAGIPLAVENWLRQRKNERRRNNPIGS